MKLDEAIENITFEDNATLQPRNDVFWNSVRLGKEAMKELLYLRGQLAVDPFRSLPGETKD